MWKRARQKQAWAVRENLKKHVGAAIAILLMTTKDHCYKEQLPMYMECCMMGVVPLQEMHDTGNTSTLATRLPVIRCLTFVHYASLVCISLKLGLM